MIRSLALGVASGLRSQVGLAVVLRRAPRGFTPLFGTRLARRLTVLTALSEAVADKIPGAPSRLDRGPLILRGVLGALAAAELARVRRGSILLAGATGALGALVSARVGHDLRARLALTHPPVAVALSEDALALALSLAATAGSTERRLAVPVMTRTVPRPAPTDAG